MKRVKHIKCSKWQDARKINAQNAKNSIHWVSMWLNRDLWAKKIKYLKDVNRGSRPNFF